VAWAAAPDRQTPDYARVCTLDASDRIRLAGLPAPSVWSWDPEQPGPFGGIARLRRADQGALGGLLLDQAGRLRLTPRLRDWLTLAAHDPSPGSPPRQVVVVAAAPFAVLALGASGILGGLLAPAPARDEWELAT
jgi:hypothetical protein